MAAAGLLVLQFALLVVSSAATYAEATPNLLSNSGFETSTDGTTPDSWSTDSWGNNTASFAYVTDAHSGVKAVQTTVSNYTDGDAKWIPNAVDVTAGKTYHYSDWYTSTQVSNVWMQSLKTDGSYAYTFLKQVPASASYVQSNVDVTMTSDVQSVRIFHVLAGNGQLTLDDTALSLNAECVPTVTNGIINGDFESSCDVSGSGVPAGWAAVQNGSTAVISGKSTKSHSGTYASSITNTSDGEVGIATTVDHPLSNQRYTLSFWQSGDTYMYAYVAYTLTNGSTQYQSLMAVPATLGEWSKYNDTFITPASTASMQIFLATSGSGTVNIDDVALTARTNQTPPTFAAGMVSITFDDGTSSSYQNAFPVLKQYGYKGTFYLNAGWLNTSGYMSSTQVKALATNGQEIGSHLYHHSDIAQIDVATLQSELSGNKTSLQSILGSQYPISSFASPYGSFTSSKVDTIMNYATSHRDTDGMFNTKANLDVRQIHAKLVTSSTSVATIQSWLTEAKNNKEWLVLVYHNIASSSANQSSDVAPYNVTPTNFSKHMAAVKNSGLTVNTVAGALSTLSKQ